MATHTHFESWYISLTFSAKQQRESSMYFGKRRPQWLIFGIFFWNSALSVQVEPEHVFRPMGVLNRAELRLSKVKYKFIFHKVSSPPSPSSLLKLPIRTM